MVRAECCFCGQPITDEDEFEILEPEVGEEYYAHADCFQEWLETEADLS